MLYCKGNNRFSAPMKIQEEIFQKEGIAMPIQSQTAQTRVSHPVFPFHYAWVICACGALIMYCNLGLTFAGFASYQPFLLTVVGLSNTQVSSIGMLRSLFGAVSMLFVTRLIGRIGIRRIFLLSSVLTVTTFLICAFSDSYTGFFIGSIMMGLAYGLGGTIAVSLLVSRWFHTHQGMALGICMAATGFSAFSASPLITRMVLAHSLRTTFLMEAGFIFLAGLLVFIFVRDDPADLGLAPLGDIAVKKGNSAAAATADSTADENPSKGKTATKKDRISHLETEPPAYLYVLACISIFFLGCAAHNLSSHYSVLYQEKGYSYSDISLLVSVFGISLAAGKCIYGITCDHLGVFRSNCIVFTIQIIGIVMCIFAPGDRLPFACLSLMLMGFGIAVGSVAISTFCVSVSTAQNYPAILSRFQLMNMIGGLAFGLVPGIIADVYGSYIPAYYAMLAMAVFAAFSVQAIYLKLRRI